jgi:ribosomal protein L11 methylase PrmA
LLGELADRGLVIGATEVSRDVLSAAQVDAEHVLEHPRLPFVSYPFEWSFEGLKAAALLTLDVHLASLESDVTLSDASAYNIQFVGTKPLFIDYLSFRRYREGEFWAGHRQFCEQFLNPLLLTAKTGVPFQNWYRGAMEGIPAAEIAGLLPLRRRFSWNVFTHVILQARLSSEAATGQRATKAARVKLGLPAFQRMLRSLRAFVAGLEPARSRRTIWADYVEDQSYDHDAREIKTGFVRDFSKTVRPKILWDLGCNTGEYVRVALSNGASTAIGFEADHGALDAAFAGAAKDDIPFLPLYMDLANPSPGGGWTGLERPGLAARANADAVLALALLHHLAIARNIPLDSAVEWLMTLAPSGILEFVPKSDPMVQTMLRLREDVFEGYTEANFLDVVRRGARVVKTLRVMDRLLVWYERP